MPGFFLPMNIGRFKIKYNSPFVLTFSFLALFIMLIQTRSNSGVKALLSLDHQFSAASFKDWFSLFTYPMVHADWAHFTANFSLILLIGPILEEKYGTKQLLLMSIFTAIITGVFNFVLFDHGLLGASGIVFMMILLCSITNYTNKEIPLTFLLVTVFYVGNEIIAAFDPNSRISHFAHLAGGACGAFFGFQLHNKLLKK